VNRQSLRNRRRAGAALVMALAFLAVLITLAVALTVSTDLQLQAGRNMDLVTKAQLAAESGIAYYAYVLPTSPIADASSPQAVLDSLATALSERLNGSASLGGQPVAYDGTAIVVPAMAFDDESSFTARVVASASSGVRLTVVGRAAPAGGDARITRSISADAELQAGSAFGHGMYAKGPIVIGDNFNYLGANNDAEASVSSALESAIAIQVGSGYIAGDVTHKPGAAVAIGATVGGQTRTADVPPPPEIDGSVFEPFATNIVDADTSGGTFTNIRIKAGTNPEFGDVTIQGVLYIEAPNVVYFKNNVNLIGVVVSEDPGPGASPATHYVYFKNNMSAQGVEALPDTPEFGALRQMVGSAFLLPGFTLEFKNNFSSISGTIAADQIITKNNLDATVYGSVIALGGGGLSFKNNASLTVDRSRYTGAAAGMTSGPPRLVILSSSYQED